jgi:polar amino acid transport system ATP-binding protein
MSELPIVQVRDLSKTYGTLTVLDHIDLDIAPGTKVAIIGPSGSGKSTLLRLLMTLERPDTGTIRVDDEYLWHLRRNGALQPASAAHTRAVRSKLGMVFQHFNLFPHMTVLRNVTLAPREVLHLPRDEAEARAVELLRLVGLEDKLDAYPAQLSGGQKQRVAIARALAMRPKVMLFDEVTSALDPELVGEVLNVLRELAHHREMTMLIVTHEMRFAQEIADRVLFFEKGRIVEDNPPDIIFTQPQEERTREFLKSVLRTDCHHPAPSHSCS